VVHVDLGYGFILDVSLGGVSRALEEKRGCLGCTGFLLPLEL